MPNNYSFEILQQIPLYVGIAPGHFVTEGQNGFLDVGVKFAQQLGQLANRLDAEELVVDQRPLVAPESPPSTKAILIESMGM